jgi:Ycf66 protein N-terminus
MMINFGLNPASFLAQVNFGTNSASILGIFLAVAGAGLYFLRNFRPELSRDQDIFFSAIGLVCGFILFFQGWRLDPILQFGQLLLVGTTVYFAVESISLRRISTEQAKRNTPIVDPDREVGNYKYSRSKSRQEAEVEDYGRLPYYEDEDEEYNDRQRPRISGSRDNRPPRDEYYDDEPPRRSERRSRNSEGGDLGDRPTSDRPSDRPTSDRPTRNKRNTSGRPTNRPPSNIDEDDWGGSSSSRSSSRPSNNDWDSPPREERKSNRRSGNPENSRSEISQDDDIATPPRKKRRRPPSDSSPTRLERDDDAMSVEYKPIEAKDEGSDNSNFDEI